MPSMEEVRYQLDRLDVGGMSKFFGGGAIKALPEVLQESEKIEGFVQGSYNKDNAILIVTDARALFVDQSYKGLQVEEFPYELMTSMELFKEKGQMTIVVRSGQHHASIKNVSEKEANTLMHLLKNRLAEYPGVQLNIPGVVPQFRSPEEEEKIRQAKREVSEYQQKMNWIASIHKTSHPPISWEEQVEAPPPFPPEGKGPYQLEAEKNMEEDKPTWRDRLFNKTEERKQQLVFSVEEAIEKDRRLYAQWESRVDLAYRVLSRDMTAYKEVMKLENLISGSPLSFQGVEVRTVDEETVELRFDPRRSEERVPKDIKSLSNGGQLSKKMMVPSRSQFLDEKKITCLSIK